MKVQTTIFWSMFAASVAAGPMQAQDGERGADAKPLSERRQSVSLRSTLRNDTPFEGSIWIDRDETGKNYSQYHQYTPEDFIKKIFVKDADKMGTAINDVIRNVKFTGSGWNNTTKTWTSDDRALLYFDHGDVTSTVHGLTATLQDTIMPRFGIEKGFLLATGPALKAEGRNQSASSLDGGKATTNYSGSLTPDADLQGTISHSLCTQTILEFDFKPYVDSVSFQYIFASTEFINFSNKVFNDAFGFFVTGNNLTDEWGNTGATINIARYPNGNPINVNESNWGYRSESGNYSDYDMKGSQPVTLGAASNQNHAKNPQYHLPVYISGKTTRDGKVEFVDCDTTSMEYDGHSIVLTAKVKLNKGEWYHMKLAIGNASDNALGSGAYLAAGSFNLGFAQMSSANPYLTDSEFGQLGTGSSDVAAGLSDSLPSHVTEYFASDPDGLGLALSDTANYEGHLYPECQRDADIKFQGSNIDLVLKTYNNSWDNYLELDGFYRNGVKIDTCRKFGSGRIASMSEFEWGDTVQGDFSNSECQIYYTLGKNFPLSLNGTVGGITLTPCFGGGVADTILFLGYSSISSNVSYKPVTETSRGSLYLGLSGGSNFVRWSSIDGTDCDPEQDSGCRWRYLRDPETGNEISFSYWEIFNLYDGKNSVPIIVQEPSSCHTDTVWIGGEGASVVVGRAIDIPALDGIQTAPSAGRHYAAGHADFTFYVKYDGEPLSVQAIGYYSKDTLALEGAYQEDGFYVGSYKYVIRQVTEPWTVSFSSGGAAAAEVSNEIASTSQTVWTSGGTLYISSGTDGTANVYSLTGALVKSLPVSGGTAKAQLPAGFYIVTFGGEQQKVMVK